MESCVYCQRIVVDELGKMTEDYGRTRNGKYMCAKCIKAFEFSIGG